MLSIECKRKKEKTKNVEKNNEVGEINFLNSKLIKAL